MSVKCLLLWVGSAVRTFSSCASRLGISRGGRGLQRSRFLLSVVLALTGGSLFTSCQMSFRDAIVNGSKDFLFTLLDPAAIVELVLDNSSGTDGLNGSP